MVKTDKPLILNAAALLSDDNDNPEYDRAIVELVSIMLGVPEEGRDALEYILRILH